MILTRDVESKPPVWVNPYKVEQAFPFGEKTLLVFGTGSDNCLQVVEPWIDVVNALDAALESVKKEASSRG